MKTLLFLFTGLLLVSTASAQSFETDTISKDHIKKLEWLTGDWHGEGWRMGKNGVKHEFKQTEKVHFKLDSTALLIEGKGHTNGKLIHNAMAVVTYNSNTGKYEFQSFLQNGKKGNFTAEIKENKFYWYPNDNVRYIIHSDENGMWQEVGEYKRGNEWQQFFEMSLSKV